MPAPVLPPGPLTNDDLRRNRDAWRAALRLANAQLAAIRCLDAAVPDSADARACLDALARIKGPPP